MELYSLLNGVNYISVTGSLDRHISCIEINSKKVQNNGLFVAIIGEKLDGHDFINEAIDFGATTIIHQQDIQDKKNNITYIRVYDTKTELGILSKNFYHNPSRYMKLIGVTGTNGKSTVTSILYETLAMLDNRTGLIGTISHKIGNKTIKSSNTTPLSHELQKLFSEMKKEDISHVAMEVSSHGLELKRTVGCDFDIAIFTNLTQEHLDFHHTMENYKQSKLKLFKSLNRHGVAVINKDDNYSDDFIQSTEASIITYGIEANADVMAHNITLSSNGMKFDVIYKNQKCTFHSKLIGKFNIYNLLAVISALLSLGYKLEEISKVVSDVTAVSGRLETVNNKLEINVIVDFAHTPDALENVLSSIKEFKKGDLISVVGCGGDRDTSKRPIMASISEELADKSIFTSDNPRTEPADKILNDMLEGVKNKEKVKVISDRKQAIEEAILNAKKDDVVLIAGKGHESYQIIGTTKYEFSDQKIASSILKKLDKNLQNS